MVLEIIALICILPLFFYSLCVIAESYICNNGEWEGDVYKGKTTLEITYKDGVPIDSTVVWKYNK